ncbi:flagellar hook-associated protein 3 [Marinomonas agarivorans]|nr:flagellar hook-associated protein 3 [Marinomonas agarivorans]
MMRVTNSSIYDQSLRDLTTSNDRYMETHRKLAESTDIVTASDDPVGAGQVMRYEAVNLVLDQYAENATRARNSLDYEEVVLDGMTQLLERAKTLLIQVENGSYSYGERQSVSDELEMLKLSAADLMNTTDSDGKFIFSGSDARRTAFVLRPDGQYEFQGDEDRKKIQVSDNVAMAASDSGKTVFEDVWTRYNYTFKQILALGETPLNIRTEVHHQEDFDTFMEDNYSAVDPTKNEFVLSIVPGKPAIPENEIMIGSPEIPAEPYIYSLTNSEGEVIKTGEYLDGDPINFLGMQVEIPIGTSEPVTGVISLNKPERGNILNQMTKVIDALRNEELGYYELESELRDATVSIRNTQTSIDDARTELGANLNTLERIASYSLAKQISNTLAQDDIASVDVAKEASNLAQQDAAIAASQKLFNKLSRLSLFDTL